MIYWRNKETNLKTFLIIINLTFICLVNWLQNVKKGKCQSYNILFYSFFTFLNELNGPAVVSTRSLSAKLISQTLDNFKGNVHSIHSQTLRAYHRSRGICIFHFTSSANICAKDRKMERKKAKRWNRRALQLLCNWENTRWNRCHGFICSLVHWVTGRWVVKASILIVLNRQPL